MVQPGAASGATDSDEVSVASSGIVVKKEEGGEKGGQKDVVKNK